MMPNPDNFKLPEAKAHFDHDPVRMTKAEYRAELIERITKAIGGYPALESASLELLEESCDSFGIRIPLVFIVDRDVSETE